MSNEYTSWTTEEQEQEQEFDRDNYKNTHASFYDQVNVLAFFITNSVFIFVLMLNCIEFSFFKFI
jgi:hypothetical protein